ncbi:PilX N-terminal domain-containing pilus assembly protein [Pseudomonas sp. NPDC007930]|uniref:pilus assembly PilX family protein n=1 Tax=Pseudomonas sp. NPDC007930 TaxID=3364417 RepID=UPI0036EFF4DB
MAQRPLNLPITPQRQRGAVLIVALVFLLLLTLIGISSMQNATLQEKMAGSVGLRNTTFQLAEAALRVGENAVGASTYTLAVCASTAACAPPDASTINAAGTSGSITWVAATTAGTPSGALLLYGVQYIGVTKDPVNFDTATATSVKLYRITAIGSTSNATGSPRTVLESIYAKQ